ncbi:signal peptidase complex catalytic subunit SEC11A-like [Paramacrobiotus metropolitanus]|uniref:signal peptidase complex catalytic subunit SEC11A-like n=1 Tax=Paramacrobiotus metropolitanus TaxID=2943436 RepID=UPI0024457E0E|nr:signal peptidase complex catalytic subunit SEC11A-like [Paramacrobiotus metropolitanus]
MDGLKCQSKRQILCEILNFVITGTTILMFWKGLMVFTNCTSPLLVVLSDNCLSRGDIAFLVNHSPDSIKVGDVIVFTLEGRDIPIVHRVMQLHNDGEGDIKFLTKGDENWVDDRGLYPQGQMWLQPKDVVGRVVGYIPSVGTILIKINEYPKMQFILLIVLAGHAILHRKGHWNHYFLVWLILAAVVMKVGY